MQTVDEGAWQRDIDPNAYFKAHFFDQVDMHNPSTRARRDDITMGNAPLRGVAGIRGLHYKVNEKLILPETRHGLKPMTYNEIINADASWLNLEEMI